MFRKNLNRLCNSKSKTSNERTDSWNLLMLLESNLLFWIDESLLWGVNCVYCPDLWRESSESNSTMWNEHFINARIAAICHHTVCTLFIRSSKQNNPLKNHLFVSFTMPHEIILDIHLHFHKIQWRSLIDIVHCSMKNYLFNSNSTLVQFIITP